MTDALLKLEEFIKVSSEVHKGPSALSIERIKILLVCMSQAPPTLLQFLITKFYRKRKQEWKRLKEKKYNSEKKNDRSYK